MGCSRTLKESMVVWVGWHQQQDQTWRRLTQSFHLGMTRDRHVDFRGQRGSETMSYSPHHHHDLAHSICGATLDDIHSSFDTGERQRHQQGWLVCATKQIFQPRTVGAGECATLAKSKAHTKSQKSTVGRNLCSKLGSGGDDLESMTWRDFDILTQRRSSRALKTMMPHVIRNENPAYYDPESTLVMDSKGLFDALDNDLPQDDQKSALEVPIIEEFMRRAMWSAFRAVVHLAAHWNVHVER